MPPPLRLSLVCRDHLKSELLIAAHEGGSDIESWAEDCPTKKKKMLERLLCVSSLQDVFFWKKLESKSDG